MKHSMKITIILILIFFTSQAFGLFTVNKFIEPGVNETTGEVYINYPDTVLGEVPEFEEDEKTYSFIPLMVMVLLGTLLIFILIKLKIGFIFKYWFLAAIFFTLFITFGVYMHWVIALILTVVLSFWKVFKPNVLIHNFTEIFVYTGIAVAFSGFLNLISAFILLVLISIYDAIAVWKSKHMIKLAEFQTESKVFAGLNIPYSLKKLEKIPKGAKLKKGQTVATAILGGGDIAFPLLFSSAAMQHFIKFWGVSSSTALLYALIMSLFITTALALLFIKGKKDRFYPAMPFISAGCFVGYIVVVLINLI